jgi:hypothetical protein
MADCRVKSCCCCCSLKCFGYFIGLMNLLGYTVLSAGFSIMLGSSSFATSDVFVHKRIIGGLLLILIFCFLAYVFLSFIFQ